MQTSKERRVRPNPASSWHWFLIAAVLMACGTEPAVTAQPVQSVAPEVEAILSDVFDEACVTTLNAERRLSDLSQFDWSVVREIGVGTDNCVGYSALPSSRTVVLSFSLHPEVRATLEAVRHELLNVCLTKDAAVETLRAALDATAGVEDAFEISTGGPIGGQPDELDEIRRHVEAGCYVYSGTGWTADGTRIYYLAGLP